MLINAVQEQQNVIERQEARIAALERGRGYVMSSLVPNGIAGMALGLIPVALAFDRKRRKPASAP